MVTVSLVRTFWLFEWREEPLSTGYLPRKSDDGCETFSTLRRGERRKSSARHQWSLPSIGEVVFFLKSVAGQLMDCERLPWEHSFGIKWGGV